MRGPVIVTAWLATPLCGDPPQLDALLEWTLYPFVPEFRHLQKQGIPHGQLDRSSPAPRQGMVSIPIDREWVGPWLVSRCSNPILPECQEHQAFVRKRINTSKAGMLRPDELKVMSTTNSWTKSYQLPTRVRPVECVRWFAVANPNNGRGLRKMLKDVHSIGHKRSIGYGQVRRWTVEEAEHDYSWFAPSEHGTVLMRTLPLLRDGELWLPENLVGWRRYFGACSTPYWHPERMTDVVIPC